MCCHEKDSPYNYFAIKVADMASGMIVGHLPIENSRVTKFFLDRRARVYAILTSTNYCKSPLVQRGLEIPCCIAIHMPSAVKNKELVRIYETVVDTLYYQREEINIVSSFIEDSMEIGSSDSKEKNKGSNPKYMRKSKMETSTSFSKDIRNFFANHGKVSNTKKERCSTNDVMQLSD